MTKAKKKEADTDFNPSEFDPAQREEGSEPGVATDTSHAGNETFAEPPVRGHIANPSSTRREPTEERGRAGSVEKKKYEPAKNPRGNLTVELSLEADCPKARLLRYRQTANDRNPGTEDMWIQFSERPEKEITDQLNEAGLRWVSSAQSDFAKGAWVLPLEPGNQWRNHANAEEVFKDVVNQIRERNGMEAFVSGAAQSAG